MVLLMVSIVNTIQRFFRYTGHVKSLPGEAITASGGCYRIMDEVNTEVQSESQAEAAEPEVTPDSTPVEAAPPNGSASVPAEVQVKLDKLQEEAQTNLNGWQR